MSFVPPPPHTIYLDYVQYISSKVLYASIKSIKRTRKIFSFVLVFLNNASYIPLIHHQYCFCWWRVQCLFRGSHVFGEGAQKKEKTGNERNYKIRYFRIWKKFFEASSSINQNSFRLWKLNLNLYNLYTVDTYTNKKTGWINIKS